MAPLGQGYDPLPGDIRVCAYAYQARRALANPPQRAVCLNGSDACELGELDKGHTMGVFVVVNEEGEQKVERHTASDVKTLICRRKLAVRNQQFSAVSHIASVWP
jgi:hypothetical protein